MQKSEENKSHKRIIRNIFLGLGIVLILGIIVNKHLIDVIFHNMFQPSIHLNDENWNNGEVYEHVKYASKSDNEYLNLYIPDNSDEQTPLLILVHGGGFVMNDLESRQVKLMYTHYRDHGYACATINYRLAQEEGFPAALEDVKAAIRFLRANATSYHFNDDNFTIWGESAGGYLATMAAVTKDNEFNNLSFIGENERSEPVSAKVSNLVDFYGCFNFESTEEEFHELGIPKWIRTISMIGFGKQDQMAGYHSWIEYFFRKDFSDMSQEEKNLYNPCYYIEKNAVEKMDLNVYIYHGTYDITVPYLQSQELEEAFVKAIGSDHVQRKLMIGYVHADDRFYTDEILSSLF